VSAGEGGGEGGRRGGEGGNKCVHADATQRPRGRHVFVLTLFFPHPQTVKTCPWGKCGCGRRSVDVCGRPDEKDVRTVIFIQKRPF
jgi:hypothetical protein